MLNKKEEKQSSSHLYFFPKNTRGQGISTNTLILVILGVIVLVVLIVGFTIGWGKLAPWLSANNVDTIVTACEASCATNSVYDFCLAKRNLKAEDVKLKDVTCNYLSTEQTKYGIAICSSIPCDDVVFVEAVSVEELDSHCVGNEGKIIQVLIQNKLESYECAAAT